MSDDIERIIERDLDSLPVLPEERWVPKRIATVDRRGASSTSLIATVFSMAALIVAIVVSIVVTAPRGTASSPVPTPASRYGLIVQSNGPVVRGEDDPTPIGRLYDEPVHRGLTYLGVSYAVSPDGGRVLYWNWASPAPGIGSLAHTTLALFDATNGTKRDVLHLGAEAGTAVVWSTDGQAALIAVFWCSDPALTQCPNLARLRTVDLATGRTTDVGPIFGGVGPSGGPFVASPSPNVYGGSVVVTPLRWDRAADRIVALVGAPNPNYASEVVVIDHGAPTAHQLPGEFLAGTVALSPDGTRLAGARTSDFAAVVWPIDDYAKRVEIVPAKDEQILQMWWRPRSDELFFVRSKRDATGALRGNQLEMWRPGVDVPRVVDTDPGSALVFRVDGSAYYMHRGQGFGGDWDIVQADSGHIIGRLTDTDLVGSVLVGERVAATASASPGSTPRSPAPSPSDPGSCVLGESPLLDITLPPPPGDALGTGAGSAEAAFLRAQPGATGYVISHAFGAGANAPVWITMGGRTFIAYEIGTPGAYSWFAYPARFIGCKVLLDQDAVTLVQSSPAGAGFAKFPSDTRTTPCVDRGGGPAPGIAISGTCRWDVVRVGSEYDVTFTFAWDAASFHLAGEPSSGTLWHSWLFHIDGAGLVTQRSQSGNFPPDEVR